MTDVLQNRSTLRIFFGHYIAHLVGLRSILPSFDALCVSCPIARKVATPLKLTRLLSLTSRLSKAECVLILITMVWGVTFLLVQHALTASGPMFFVGLRFAAAAVIVSLFSLRSLRGITLFELKAGMFIGVSIMLGYGLQTIGLQTIPSSQSAFITALYVPFVPLLQWLVLGRRPGLMPSLGIMLAFTGLMLLSGPERCVPGFQPGGDRHADQRHCHSGRNHSDQCLCRQSRRASGNHRSTQHSVYSGILDDCANSRSHS